MTDCRWAGAGCCLDWLGGISPALSRASTRFQCRWSLVNGVLCAVRGQIESGRRLVAAVAAVAIGLQEGFYVRLKRVRPCRRLGARCGLAGRSRNTRRAKREQQHTGHDGNDERARGHHVGFIATPGILPLHFLSMLGGMRHERRDRRARRKRKGRPASLAALLIGVLDCASV